MLLFLYYQVHVTLSSYTIKFTVSRRVKPGCSAPIILAFPYNQYILLQE